MGTEASLTGKEASRAYAAKRLRTKVVLPSPVSPTSRIFMYLRQVAGGEERKRMSQPRVAVPCPPAGSFMYLRQAKTTSGVERRGENMNRKRSEIAQMVWLLLAPQSAGRLSDSGLPSSAALAVLTCGSSGA